jgi:hypothetical protein
MRRASRAPEEPKAVREDRSRRESLSLSGFQRDERIRLRIAACFRLFLLSDNNVEQGEHCDRNV